MAPRGPSASPAASQEASRRRRDPQGKRCRRGTGCFGSRVTGACLPSCALPKTRRVTVDPVLPNRVRRHAGSHKPVTASWLQSRWRASQEARCGRSRPSGRGHSSYGSLAAFRGVEQAGINQAPRVPGRSSTSLASSIRQLVAEVLNAHEPPRSTRCSGNASANGVSEPGIWTQAARCIRSPQGGRAEVSNALPFFGRTRQVASRASGDPPLLAVVTRS